MRSFDTHTSFGVHVAQLVQVVDIRRHRGAELCHALHLLGRREPEVLDRVAVTSSRAFEEQFLEFMAKSHAAVAESIRQSKKFEKETAESLTKAIEEFKTQFAGTKKVFCISSVARMT